MPPELMRAHEALDRSVDAGYGRKEFPNEESRLAFLFARYLELTNPLDLTVREPHMAKPKGRKRASAG
jgi:hypothetical protein